MGSMHMKSAWWSGILLLAAVAFLPQSLSAHNGCGLATDEEFEITGGIVSVRLGNPHGEIVIF
jgi:hypothetical protein